MYADDLIILSASILDLQSMLEICDSVGSDLGIKFNPLKSKCISIGHQDINDLAKVNIGSIQLPWVDKIDYLGITILYSKSFQVDLAPIRRKFFASTNFILSKCSKTSDMVKLFILESHCLPVLLYASESLNLPPHQIIEINSWWNSVFRKIFNYNKWESVRALISYAGRLDVHHIINLRSLNFIIKMNLSAFTPMCIRSYLHQNYNFKVNILLRSEEHTSELQSQSNLVCRLLLEKKKK